MTKCNRMDFNWVEARIIAKKTILKVSPGINRDLLEDLVQDAIERAYLKVDKFDASKGAFNAWINRLTRNLFFDFTRKHSKYHFVSEDLQHLIDEENDFESIEDFENNLRIAVDELKDRDKELIDMRYFKQLSFEEMEEFTGISAKSLPVYMSRARNELKRHYLQINKQIAA